MRTNIDDEMGFTLHKETPDIIPELAKAYEEATMGHYDEQREKQAKQYDNVNHPKHYTNHPSGIECIQITEHMSFNLGNAFKYIWRADLKNGLEDLKKAQFYINREIDKREKENK